MQEALTARHSAVILDRDGVLVIDHGYVDEAAVARLHGVMQADLATDFAHIDAFYTCPFHPEAVVAAYRHANHPDRKPNPGMILRAIADWSIDPARRIIPGLGLRSG